MGGRLVRPLAALALVLPALWLAWYIVSTGMVAHLRETSPQAALDWRKDDAQAWAATAEIALAGGHVEEAADRARRAIAKSPIEVRGYRVLGQVAARRGDTLAAQKLFAAGSRLTRRESSISYWLYRDALLQRRYEAAFFHADALMRRAPRSINFVVPDLVNAVADPRAVQPLAARMAFKPQWRLPFIRAIAVASPGQSGLAVLRALEGTASPASNDEVTLVLRQMFGAGDVEAAYRAWLSFLPADARPKGPGVYDGKFERHQGPEPFGWRLREGGAATAEPIGGAGPGIEARQGGFEEVWVARQFILLPPGQYRLTSQGQLVEGPEAALEWRLACRNGQPVTRAAMRFDSAGAATAQADFSVPEGCPVQELTLNTVGSDRMAASAAQITSITIAPAGEVR